MKNYGLNVEGNVRIFRKDKEIKNGKKTFIVTDVWFNVSEKEEDGSYFNKSMNLIFKKGLDKPTNNEVITIKGFPIITGEGNYRKIAIMVMDWLPYEELADEVTTEGITPVQDGDMPF